MTTRKAIFITGGASGIGRAIAVKFGHEGWFVGLGDLDDDGMRETESLLPGGYSYSHRLDVSDAAGWKVALQSFATATGGRIDVLANNAGIPSGGPLAEITLEEIDRLLDVNLRGVFYGAKAAYPYLQKTAPGSCLLNTGSAAAFYGLPNQSAYGASKAAVRSLTESLDAEWAPEGIKVRSLMPSYIDTPLVQQPLNRGSDTKIRDAVIASGLEFTPVEAVADAAWAAVHGDAMHHPVGKSAKELKFAARWTPGKLRQRTRALFAARNRGGDA